MESIEKKIKGVMYIEADKKWHVKITINGIKYEEKFNTKEEAEMQRKSWEKARKLM
jgi:hypothetical protein